ncbi:PilZ domain-containing protein, partial [Azospirillum sp.]|uniref:PilZ domain-containing protein n=1 Tax=Azospirillum sp. TaxID=34012 RepID=UPI002D29CCA4
EVSAHIDEVAQEALSTGAQADTVRDAAGEVVAGVQALQRVMVRTIRTASPEVDRRRKPRFRVDERCAVTIGGESRTGGVTNLSEGGAIVTGAPAAEPGAFGRLRLERGGAELPFTVVGAGEDRLHVKFVLDDDARTRFLPVFRDITRGLTPLGEGREAAA